MIANVCDLSVGDFIHTLGDAHIYSNHFEQAHTQLQRETKELPQLNFSKKFESINDFKFEDFEIANYNPHPSISASVAI
jgi:thymidylate synthase